MNKYLEKIASVMDETERGAESLGAHFNIHSPEAEAMYERVKARMQKQLPANVAYRNGVLSKIQGPEAIEKKASTALKRYLSKLVANPEEHAKVISKSMDMMSPKSRGQLIYKATGKNYEEAKSIEESIPEHLQDDMIVSMEHQRGMGVIHALNNLNNGTLSKNIAKHKTPTERFATGPNLGEHLRSALQAGEHVNGLQGYFPTSGDTTRLADATKNTRYLDTIMRKRVEHNMKPYYTAGDTRGDLGVLKRKLKGKKKYGK